MKFSESRRNSLKKLMAGGALLSTPSIIFNKLKAGTRLTGGTILGEKINHSACRWCYNDIPLEVLCEKGKAFGLQSVDLIGPKEWPVVQEYGLTSAMGNGAQIDIARGWNNPIFHDTLIQNYKDIIPVAAKYKIPNIICLSGNRNGIDDETGLKNCTDGLKKIMADAEKYKVNIVMELLNSKVDHKDYHCDHTWWGVELCNRVGSENLKLLYDIYHMQIMEGDVIRTIRENIDYIAHFHTGGVPGRHEIDETQELYYPAIMQAISESGFKGYVAQEFVPTWDDKLAALEQAIKICTV
jgi:hydroxypyruvate isomerase